ncbi:hypothetical protein [Photobacterium kagoshimensis]|uniref:hypothetical protein n=1 Tax=Photobacterium kagoshimensis TaxID=2910242 RepID=UPI003D14E309
MNGYQKSAQPQTQTLLSDTLRLPPPPSRFSTQVADENIELSQQFANWKHFATALSKKLDNNQDQPDSDESEPRSSQDQHADIESALLQEDERFLQEVLRSLRKLNGKVQIR